MAHNRRHLPTVPHAENKYIAFRQRALHLSKLSERGHLTITSIIYEEPWPYDDGTQISADELAVAFENGYRWLTHHAQDPPVLSRRIVGRMLVSNYDPANRTLAQRHPQNLVMIDVDPNFPGGEFPLQGWVKLRSLRTIIEFLAQGIADEPEFPVDPDPRTGPVTHNPERTLTIHETEEEPDDAAFAVRFRDHVYSIKRDAAGDLNMFRALYRLFQMTMTDVSTIPVPAITIGK